MLILVIASFVACWGFGARFAVPARVTSVLDRYVISLALPALIIATMSTVDIDSGAALPVVCAWVSMALCALGVVLVGRALNWGRSTVGALLMVGVLGNTSFLGIGVVRAVLGDEYVAAAISYDQLGTFLALATYGSWVAGRFGTGEHDPRHVVVRLLQFPPFVALLIAFVLRSVDVPAWATDTLAALGKTVAPVAMGALGLRFTLRVTRRAVAPAVWGLAIKMVSVPTLMVALALILGNRHDTGWAASVMQSAAPPMVTAGIVAVNAGLDEEVVSFMVGVGTLLGFALLPAIGLVF